MKKNIEYMMPCNFNINSFLNAVFQQNKEALRFFFESEAVIIWANTNEQFTVEEYIRANCEYPGRWEGVLEDLWVLNVYDKMFAFIVVVRDETGEIARTVSFVKVSGTDDVRITHLTEYWGDIGAPPLWRQKKYIGKKYIKNLTV